MLEIVRQLSDLSFSSLCDLYWSEPSVLGDKDSIQTDDCRRRMADEQDFYAYLRSVFFMTPEAFYAIGVDAGRYVSAVRVEPFRDGYILAGLVTHAAFRRHGFGKKLLSGVIDYVKSSGDVRLYSHIDRQNYASIELHKCCGFREILDYAVFLDGSVSQKYHTFLLDN